MDLKDDLEARIRARGFRVEERLALLAALVGGRDEAIDPLQRGQALLDAVRAAARNVRKSLP